MKDPVIEHVSGEREFRIRIEISRERCEVNSRDAFYKLMQPLAAELLKRELQKETRPFSWRREPQFATELPFGENEVLLVATARGQYTDLTSAPQQV